MRSVYIDYAKGKFTLRDLVNKENSDCCIGLNAIVNHEGMREDGSYRYGKAIAKPDDSRREDYEFKDTFRRIEKGINIFTPGSMPRREKLGELEMFLAEAHKRNIHVVLFLPPYAPTVYERLKREKGRYAYLEELKPAIEPIAEKYGARFFDLSNPAVINSGDHEFIDGFHGSEKTYLRLFIYMGERDPELKVRSDIQKLKFALEKAERDFEVFE